MPDSTPHVPALALEGIAKGQGEPPDVLTPAATPDELEADPLLLVRQQCETMLQQGSRRWDLTTVPREKCDELGRTLRAALLSFEHAIYLRVQRLQRRIGLPLDDELRHSLR